MAVTVSPKYQVVIPKEIREQMGIEPGQKWEFVRMGKTLRLVRVKKASEFFGILKGVKNDFDRGKEWADAERDRLLGLD